MNTPNDVEEHAEYTEQVTHIREPPRVQKEPSDSEICDQAIQDDILSAVHSVIAQGLGNEMFAVRSFLVPAMERTDRLLAEYPVEYTQDLMQFHEYTDSMNRIRDLIGRGYTEALLIEMRKVAGYSADLSVEEKTRNSLVHHYQIFRLGVQRREEKDTEKWKRKRKLLELSRSTEVEDFVQETGVKLVRFVDMFVRERQELLGETNLRMLLDMFVPRSATQAVDIRPRGSLKHNET